MTPKEISAEIKRLKIDRRELAKSIGCKYGYLNNMLNEFCPFKQEWLEKIEKELKGRNE